MHYSQFNSISRHFVHFILCKSYAPCDGPDILAMTNHFPHFNIGLLSHRRPPPPPPLPRPRPIDLPPPPGPATLAVVAFLDFVVVSSMSNASKFNDSGNIHVRIVEPRTLNVGNDTGFFPRLNEYQIQIQ